MKKFTYRTKGTCSSQIELELDGNVVHNVKFTGGCDGNLKAIPKLVEGMTVEEIESRRIHPVATSLPKPVVQHLSRMPDLQHHIHFLCT